MQSFCSSAVNCRVNNNTAKKVYLPVASQATVETVPLYSNHLASQVKREALKLIKQNQMVHQQH